MRTEDDADETLMLRYRNGDADAFAALYARHKGALYRYLLRQCGQPALAEELFQDVWLKLIAARTGYTVQARFTTYLYRLAHNRLIDHYRASSRGLPLSYAEDCPEWTEVPAPDENQPEAQDDRRRQAERLLELLTELPEAQREAVRTRNVLKLIAAGGNAYYLAKFAGIFGLDMQDIGAQQTGMTKDQFKAKLLKARE